MPLAKNRDRFCKFCTEPFKLNEDGAGTKFCSIKHSREYFKENSYKNIHTKNKTRDREKNNKLKVNYGITLEERNKLIEKQNKVCAICLNPPTKDRHWHVDHCHITKQIRGILCSKCNQGLGLFKDDINLLESAIRYLNENHVH